MGIPSYFSFIVKNHKSVIRLFNGSLVNRLYIDSNSILYDAIHTIDFSDWTTSIAKTNAIIDWTIKKIKEYMGTINPSTLTYIAFDGVAPVAKMSQQRNRRYKSWYQSNMMRDIMGKTTSDPWNTSSFTPGTAFMDELNVRVKEHFLETPSVIYSGSDVAGEGEHKIFQHIRSNPSQDETIVVYGLDADLIMLSITHLPTCANLFLFRETPHFIQTINNGLEPNKTYMLDIPELAKHITLEMNNGIEMTTEMHHSRIYDYILICFMLGNDFMPHFPSINIRTGGIQKLLNAYKETIGKSNAVLTDGTNIHWKQLRLFIGYLSNLEELHFKEETRLREKRSRRMLPTDTPEARFKQFEALPTYDRETERYINPYQKFWQSRYYKALFNNQTSAEFRSSVCENYMQGLEWCLKYYTQGCPDWKWSYNHSYPPLLEDLVIHIPVKNQSFMISTANNVPVHPYVQLCYVLPKTSLHLLPEELQKRMLTKYDHFYSMECDFMWAYCKYFWESHVELPEIDIALLEEEVKSINSI
jgi:5'-3' exonuclease